MERVCEKYSVGPFLLVRYYLLLSILFVCQRNGPSTQMYAALDSDEEGSAFWVEISRVWPPS